MTAIGEPPLRYIDSDGHILEPPTGMLDFAPAKYRDRIWHIETDSDGLEWVVWDDRRTQAGGLAGTAARTGGLTTGLIAGLDNIGGYFVR